MWQLTAQLLLASLSTYATGAVFTPATSSPLSMVKTWVLLYAVMWLLRYLYPYIYSYRWDVARLLFMCTSLVLVIGYCNADANGCTSPYAFVRHIWRSVIGLLSKNSEAITAGLNKAVEWTSDFVANVTAEAYNEAFINNTAGNVTNNETTN